MLVTTHQLFKVLVLPLLFILLVRSLYSQPSPRRRQHVFEKTSSSATTTTSSRGFPTSTTSLAEQVNFWKKVSGEDEEEEARKLRSFRGVAGSARARCALLRETAKTEEPKPNTELGREWASCQGKRTATFSLSQIAAASSRCRQMMARHRVKPGSSWGTLPLGLRQNWTEMKCDDLVLVAGMRKREKQQQQPRRALPPLTDCPIANNETRLPLIALCCGTTTRTKKGWIKEVSSDLSTLALFKHLLPSFKRTLECGFRYVIVVGYDVGDRWWDQARGDVVATRWFENSFRKQLRKNVEVTLQLARVNNDVQKPGPVFTAVTKRAYDVGADYLYRVNDDTELAAPWARRFVDALTRLDGVGVVGPTCKQGNRKILTHDFTHRGHMDIFEQNYYPTELSDWWMDDWISRVYGPRRTWRDDRVEVVHHTQHHGQRYVVDKSHASLLDNLVRRGQEKINKHLEEKTESQSPTSSSSPPPPRENDAAAAYSLRDIRRLKREEGGRTKNSPAAKSTVLAGLVADGYSALDSSPEGVARRKRIGKGYRKHAAFAAP